MYAIIASGGKQYRVQEGDVLRLEKLDGDVGASISFGQVLMVSDGEAVQLGRPVLEGASVHAHIVEQDKAKKILVFKFKRRKHFRKREGHRQPYTAVKIDRIEA
jgi:large subunit ribosomal protein L21